MSGLRKFSDGRRPEKSSFAQTCNLLSRYIKEKGSLRNLNIEIGGKVESLEAIVKPGSTHCATASTTMNVMIDKGKSVEQYSTQQHLDSPILLQDASYNSTRKEGTTMNSKASQLTIFYSGRVLVFDEYPDDKARELMSYAKKQSSQVSYGILSNQKPGPCTAGVPASSPREGLPPRPQASTSSQKAVGVSSKTCKDMMNANGAGDHVDPQPEPSGSELPIARRSSLHRFLEKRKDRAAARGPYHQVEEQADTSSGKGDEQLELRL